MDTKKLLNAAKGKSKTINSNVLIGAFITIAGQFGYQLSAETVTAIYIVANTILRFVTSKALDEK